jgi:hypothetical protein
MFSESFYPTPRHIAARMVAKISDDAQNYLDPSAGKGDLAEVMRDRNGGRYHYGHKNKVDCVEINPELASILSAKEFSVVGYDWLTYPGVSYYDAICMNPPFAQGAAHLLRAWDFMYDGEIVCLLNKETLANPYTAERQRLAAIIADNGGTVEDLGPCFDTAIRKTDVEVSMVYLRKVAKDDRIEAWATMTGDEAPVFDDINAPENQVAVRDVLGNLERYYNEATTHMLKGFQHLRKAALYLEANGIGTGEDYRRIAGMGLDNINSARAEFSRKHRRDAWMHALDRPQFTRILDKKQREQFIRDIETNSNIPFTADNIRGTLENLYLQRGKIFEMSVWNVFEELTRYFKGNTNHTEGWKSNDNYKVNQKLVFPWGCEWDTIFNKFQLRYNGPIDVYNDLDRVLAILDGEKFEEILTIGQALGYKFRPPGSRDGCTQPGTCNSSYFEIRFFKKGTVHLKWKDLKLWEKFNITAAKGRKWVGSNTKGAL